MGPRRAAAAVVFALQSSEFAHLYSFDGDIAHEDFRESGSTQATRDLQNEPRAFDDRESHSAEACRSAQGAKWR